MENTRIIYKNYWRDGNIYGYSSQHPQHPATDSQVDTLLQFFRSRYGSGSGNGLITIGSKKYIDFNEGGGELIATLTEGNYNGNSLATEIKTQLDAAGGQTYTVSYSESTAKITISAPSNFSLLWKTGTHGSDNTDTHVGTVIGFDDSADDSGTDEYTSDNRRIHYPACYASNNLGAAYSIDFLAILSHNISSDATIKAIGADDEDFTTNVVEEEIAYNANNLYYFFDSAETRQYWKIEIQDPTNPNDYIQMGHIVLGAYTELNKIYGKDHDKGKEDLSEEEYSDSRVLYSQQKNPLDTKTLPYKGLSDTSVDAILAMFEESGRSKSVIFCFDYSDPNDNSYYVRNAELNKPQYKHVDNWNWTANLVEVV